VMVRSILLRGFDQQLANMIGSYMECHGIKYCTPATRHSSLCLYLPVSLIIPCAPGL
jgi:hypothetical protein